MSEPRLISPMLDNFLMGDPISDHNGVKCCPAMHKDTEEKYLVKVISVPASRTSLDALLLTGAYSNEADALAYYEDVANGVVEENNILAKLSKLEGFIPFDACQKVPMDDDIGFDIYLLTAYKRTLEKHFNRVPMTHLSAINLGIDLCAALTVCRRSGYLYVDLKPSNIFVVDQNFRIGDLGFLPIDGLKYISLPDKYRSAYTAPEISDAFSDLNTTIDIYAAGLILYQAYNDGALPTVDEEQPDSPFPAPAYADYEMAEIILKACANDPADRWQTPEEMGQALISYMQRNGANDTPIVPIAVAEEENTETISDENASSEEVSNEEERGLYEQSADNDSIEIDSDAIVEEEINEEEITEDTIYTVDEDGNLTFLDEQSADETAPENNESAEDVAYTEISEEVSEIMTYADELISHPAPDPVVAPEKIDVPIPEPIVEEPEETIAEESDPETEETDSDDAIEELTDEPEESTEVDNENPEESAEETEEEILAITPAKTGKIIRNIFIALAASLIALGAFLYYKFVYMQHVSIQVTGEEGILTVYVDSKFNEEKLTVICTDTYGNQLTEQVSDGKAVFTDLMPNSAYTVQVKALGFHRLTGKTSTAYSTPSQTTIAQFIAVCGDEDGSVILNFAVDGNDSEQWKIRYSAENEVEKEVVFTGHIATINNLTIGTEYTFTVEPLNDEYFTGENTVKFTATKMVLPTNLKVESYADGKLAVSWSVADGMSVSEWSVHCYDGANYNEIITVTENRAEFTNIDTSASYTVEVVASGMHQGAQLFVAKNPIKISNLSASVKAPETVTLTWESDNQVSETGWILKYTVNDSEEKEIANFSENTVQVPKIPANAVCKFSLYAADNAPVFDGEISFTMPQITTFNRYDLTPGDLLINMCRTPNKTDWTYRDIPLSDYTNTYKVGERATILLSLKKIRGESNDMVTTTYIFKDTSGNVVSSASEQAEWDDMWDNGHCALALPDLPGTAGSYTVDIYFNEQFLYTANFTVN